MQWKRIVDASLPDEWQATAGNHRYKMVCAHQVHDQDGAWWCIRARELDLLNCDMDLFALARDLSDGSESDIAAKIFGMQVDTAPFVRLPNLAVCSAVIGTVVNGTFDIFQELGKHACEFKFVAYKVASRPAHGKYEDHEIPQTRETHYLTDEDEVMGFISKFVDDKYETRDWEVIRSKSDLDTVIWWYLEVIHLKTGELYDYNSALPNGLYKAMAEAEINYAGGALGYDTKPWHIGELIDLDDVMSYEY